MQQYSARLEHLERVILPLKALNDHEGVTRQYTASSAGTGLLHEQVAIITGSGQGVGAAAARLFAEHGAKVVVSDIDAAKAQQVAKEIQKAGGTALAVPGDVTDPAFPQKIVEATIQEFGVLHHLVNNAGYTWDGVIHKMTDKQWQAMLLVHATAPFRLIQAASPYMREAAKQEMQKGAAQPRSILNISSTSGTHGNAGQANYSTAKAGLIGLTKTVAKELGPFNIRCNCIAFSFIQTRLIADRTGGSTVKVGGESVKVGMPNASQITDVAKQFIPLRRLGSPEEAAGSMLMLTCPFSSYISGQILEVTGGGMI